MPAIQLTDTVKKLLIAYVGVFIVQLFMDKMLGGAIFSLLALTPSDVLHGKIWQIFTYSFLHADTTHLVLNGIVLAFLAPELEIIWGRKKFLTFYFFCIGIAALFYMLAQVVAWNPAYLNLPMVGASGGIYGLLMAYGLLFSDRQMLFMMMFPMQAKHFIWVLAGIEFLQIFSSQSWLSSVAHLSGMGAGYVFLWVQAKGFDQKGRSGAQSKNKPKNRGHLKLVSSDQSSQSVPESERDGSGKKPPTWH